MSTSKSKLNVSAVNQLAYDFCAAIYCPVWLNRLFRDRARRETIT